VRTFSKAKRFEIDSENLKNFRDISSVGDEIDNGREFFRGLFKVLAGKNWASEMYMLGQLEVLRVVSRSLNSFLSSRSAKEISNIASQESSPVERAKALILASGAQDCWTLLDNLVDVASSVGKVAVT
jgi:hypothetical protein